MSSSTNLLQSSKYKCFWDFLHVQTGAQIIAALVLFNCCMDIVDFPEEKGLFFFILKYFNIFSVAFFFGLIFLGIRQSNVKWFGPSLLYTATVTVVYGFFDVVCLIAANSKSSLGRLALTFLETVLAVKVTDDNLLYAIVRLAIDIFIHLFFFDILYRCSKYIKEKSCQENCTLSDPKCTQSDYTLVFQSSFPEVKESSTA